MNRRVVLTCTCGLVASLYVFGLHVSRSLAEESLSVKDRFHGYLQSDMILEFSKATCLDQGYATDTIEGIVRAMQSPQSLVRMAALLLLTKEAGEEAIPPLKEALDDQSLFVRLRVAELLASLGDMSGLPIVQADYDSLVPKATPVDPNKADPNAVSHPLTGPPLFRALTLATSLAKFGDPRGYELAVETVTNGKPPQRVDALDALFEINRWTDETTLGSQRRNPASILIAVAESEKDPRVLSELANRAVSHARGDLRKLLLGTVARSPHATEQVRARASGILEQLQRDSR
jgi:HEAT repeat protein